MTTEQQATAYKHLYTDYNLYPHIIITIIIIKKRATRRRLVLSNNRKNLN